MDSITLSKDQVEVSDPIVNRGRNLLRIATLALFALAAIVLLGFGPSHIASEFGLSHSTANWITWIVVYESWEYSHLVPLDGTRGSRSGLNLLVAGVRRNRQLVVNKPSRHLS